MRQVAGALFCLVLSAACEGGGRPRLDDTPLAAPPRAGFEPVAEALIATCGTLDCHGQLGRNLRLYGGRSLRLGAMSTAAEGETTDEEYQASNWSVVGLEPEIMDVVVREAGDWPERLSMFRKALGIEKHTGGTLFEPRDALDQCLRSWLAGRIRESACILALPMRPKPRAKE